ncbi:hypothetical protein H072_4118 [Dactylellina haptotyla CBS 200.50]|uniref:GPI anchored serine-threonine rich protein n=1 Tax=Dactylellina haptotyla (strain CBS 200.50) TaxID=1284197 RepID=S8BR46_DACHA|nr:hypothetical protein H072_4118 [Dactylellina haptotyla CBS 200.50]
MARYTVSQFLILLCTIKLAVAAPPPGGISLPMALMKRQDLCVGPVICDQTATTCTSCESGFYCTFDGGCCEEGLTCSGFKPCVNAGTPAPTETQICPTDAPICTASDGIPVCSGSIDDWIAISQALGGAVTTDASTFTTSSAELEPTSTPNPSSDALESSTSETESSASTPEPTETTSQEVATTTAFIAETPETSTTSSGPSTTATSAPVSPNSAVKTQLGLATVVGFVLLTVFAL